MKIYRDVHGAPPGSRECVVQTMFVSALAMSVLESPFVKSAVEEFVLAALTMLYNSPALPVIYLKLEDGTQQSEANLNRDTDTI